MAAAGLVSTPQQAFSGVRPVQLRGDLAAIADLIELCFAPTLDAAGRSAIQEMRMVSRSGPLLWVLARLDRALLGMIQGFVWVERGHIVGNVSVMPAGFERGYLIANVAVHPDFRRQGIARQLMQAALDQIARRGTFATLQVEADNAAACALYESLGFHTQRIFTRWRRPTYHHLPPALPEMPVVRKMDRREVDCLYTLARQVRPDEHGGMGWLRPTRSKTLRPSRWGSLAFLISGQSVDYWIVPAADGQFDAALRSEARLGCTTVLFDLLVRPERQGQLEVPLISDAIRRLGGRHQPLVTEHPADDPAAEEVLRDYHFRPERTLAHMIRAVEKF
jgi:ribosomal protein S18 acetylase RimI-like enzyme